MMNQVNAFKLLSVAIRSSITNLPFIACVFSFLSVNSSNLAHADSEEHVVPCHHNLEKYLDEYIAAADIANAYNGPLFRTVKTGEFPESRACDA
jgi:hypothetical protein